MLVTLGVTATLRNRHPVAEVARGWWTDYWQLSLRAADSFRERTRAGHNADSDAEAAGDPCTRGNFCSGRRIVVEAGERKVIPARTYGPFCQPAAA